MRRYTWALAVICCAATLASVTSAQDSASPGGLVALRGVIVVNDEQRLPIRRARVWATWTDGRADPVFTDDRGRFEIVVRRSGGYSLSVSKPGYASSTEFREAVDTSEPIEIRLMRGAVITGTVHDGNGKPVVGTGIVVRKTDPSGTTYSSGEHVTDTDDRGEFRVGSLAAGPYAVVVARSGSSGSAGWQSGIFVNGAVDPNLVVHLRAGEEQTVHRVLERMDATATASTAAAAAAIAARLAARNNERALNTATARAGTIAGRVLDADARPVAAAVVGAFPVSGSSTHVFVDGSYVGLTQAAAASDAQGRYQLSGLPPDTYRLVASVPSDSRLGLPMERAGTIVTLRDGERAMSIDVAIPRGSAIAGTVVDEFGEPLEGITVQAWQARWKEGRHVVAPAVGAPARKTDDQGRYRVYGLVPGAYYPVVLGDDPRPLTTSGRLEMPAATDRSPRHVFHPGTPAISEAVAVEVHGDRDVVRIDISLSSTPLARVYGQVLDSSGEPFRGLVTLTANSRSGAPVPEPLADGVQDGTFEFMRVAPGDYVLQAVTTNRPEDERRVFQAISGKVPQADVAPRREIPVEFGMSLVTVSTDDVGPLSVRTAGVGGASLEGRVVVSGGVSSALPAGLTIIAVPADGDAPAASRQAVVTEGAFEMTGLTGPVRFALHSASPGWRLELLDIDGVNAAEDPVTFGSTSQFRHVEAVLTRSGGEISGRVSGPGGSRSGAMVLVFPADRSRWYDRSPFLRLTTSDSEGRFRAAGLPAAEYLVVALPARSVDLMNEWGNPSVFSALAPNGRRVVLGKDGLAAVDVPLTVRRIE